MAERHQIRRLKEPRIVPVDERLDRIVEAIAPAFVQEFFRTGGEGEAWSDYNDLATSIVYCAQDILARVDNREL